ncbi:hypothetical protein BGZ57DRAFT_747457, partial [Hyaloscypha finlandica]
LPPPTCKKVLITGASGGLGLAAAVHYINLGAPLVIITARDASKGEAAIASIEAQTGTVRKGIVKFMLLDMSAFASTKCFADKLKSEIQEIDILLLTAGALNTSFNLGPEGYEETIQVTVLGTALLALHLLPWVKVAGKGKAYLGFVTSGIHRCVAIDAWPKDNVLQWLSKEENWPCNMYATAKLLEQYVANEIGKLDPNPFGVPEVIMNPMCPEMAKSDLGRAYKKNYLLSLGVDIFSNQAMKTTEGGARTLVLATMTTQDENGKYYTNYQSDENCKLYIYTVQNNILGPEGQEMQAEVWKEVLAILEEKVPEAREILHRAMT